MGRRHTDYEVTDLRGQVVFTSDDAEIARRWADRHCLPRSPLAVERVEQLRSIIHVADQARVVSPRRLP